MAPSRRKGVSKAAATAAATTRREWKVRDLVLAKVKGFPAWPATVSEPEKWGYPADRKKVLVHFFGTQQIGFCNPADVEEFTEERKLSLSGKRHGKGADFVRAVNEIIISFEKLKKREQISSANEIAEIIINNENKSDESSTKCVNDKDSVIRTEPHPLCTVATNDLNSLTEAAAAAAEDALLDAEMQLEEARLFTETPVSTTYSTRSKTEVTQSRNRVIQGRISARRLRSSSKIDAKGPQNIILPSLSHSRRSRNSGTNASKDRSLRRGARIMKSSDDSEGYDADSPASVSNDSIEENASEVMTVDSYSPSFNNGSTVESHCKPIILDHFSENNNEEETELSDRLDFQTSIAIIKKKRGPNRKRHSDDVVGPANSNAAVSDAEVRNGSVSPSTNKKLAERYAREDGDEHLPLVKRARVRMERSAPAKKEEGIMAHKEEKVLEVAEILATQISGPLNCKVDDPGDGESVPIEVDSVSMPLLPASPIKPQSREVGKNLCENRNFAGGEAVLPPSKRLHRALEAMSANVAEDIQTASSFALTVSTKSNGDGPSIAECSELSIGTKPLIELVSAPAENHSNIDSNFNSSKFCDASNTETPLIDSKTHTTLSDCVKSYRSDSSNPELCKDSTEHTEGADFKCLKVSPLELDSKHFVKLDPPNIGEEEVCLDCNAPGFIMSPTNHCKIECSELNATIKGSGPDIPQVSSAASTYNCNAIVQIDNAVGEGDTSHSMKGLSLAKNKQDSQKSEFVKERSPVSKFSNCAPSGSPVKVLTSDHYQCLSNSFSISNEPLEDFAVTQSSSLTNGPHLFAKTSPPSSPIGNVSTSDINYLENRSSCSPDIQLNYEKAKHAGKSNSKGEETLSSFEAAIRSLLGTKESIGRATRIAIDCAKFGFAFKVVEILAQNLERESNSHKKVELFFLVDSIAQCSRGMKGDGGIYSSVIQAVLPRLLLAAAPPGSSSLENHRQCLKVLRVWQERRILPEPIIHHHIRELDALCVSYPKAGSCRSLRNERAFDDPIREMEGMLVDEYGSNSSFQLPGFCMPRMLRDDVGSDSDGESFEAVTPEHNVEKLDGERALIPAGEKRSHILEDVDGELEMEDVAPYREEEISSTSNLTKDHTLSHHQSDNHYGPSLTSQQPKNALLALPRSPSHPPPPPPPYPLPPSRFPHAVLDSTANGPNSNMYPSSQNFDNDLPGYMEKQPGLPRMKPTNLDPVHHRARDNKDFEAQVPRQIPDSINTCSFNDRHTSHLSAQGSNRIHQPGKGGFNKGLHVRPPHPAPSSQFSYPQQRQIESRRDIRPPSHPSRFHMRNEENSNFFRDRDRNKFVTRDNIGECWRPPLPPISGQCYRNGARMSHGHMPYSSPPREPSTNSRWNFPPRPPNHRQFNPYRTPEGPIPVGNRGPNYWRPR